MRVILIQNDLPPDHFGGVEVLTLNLAKNFRAKGVDVVLLTRRLPFHQDDGKIQGIPIKRIGLPYRGRHMTPFHRMIWFLSYIFVGCLTCIKLRPTVVHSTMRAPGGFVSGISGYLTQASSFLSIQSNLDAISFVERVLARMVLNLNQHIVVPTKFSRDQVNQLCSRNIHIIPNSIEFQDQSTERRTLNHNLLFIGRLHPIKGLTYAIKACQVLKERDIPFVFNIIGTGQEYSRLKALVEDLHLEKSIFFHGRVSDVQKQSFLRQSSYFVLSSLSECFPITLLEAMKERLYIIATRVGGVPEILCNGKFGAIVPPRDHLSFANTLEAILMSAEAEKIQKINEVYRYAKNSFDMPAVLDGLLKTYLQT